MHDLLLWLLASVALYALASNLAWAWATESSGWKAALRRPPWPQVARLLCFLGLPALALLRKVPGIDAGMGLAPEPGGGINLLGRLHWAWSLLVVLGLAAVAAGIWAFGRAWHARARGETLAAKTTRLGASRIAALAEEALLQESHWAFYRAAILASGLVSQDLAVFISLLVLGLEAWASPFLRLASRRVEALERQGQTLALAALSATAFLCTGGFLWSYLSQWLAMLLLGATGLYLEGQQEERGRPSAPGPLDLPPSPGPERTQRRIEPTVV